MPRTHDDSWDLANSVGATAERRAIGIDLRDDWPAALRESGFDLDAAELLYLGERSIVVDYLTCHNWQVNAHPTKELYARSGFQFPEDEMLAIFGEMSYVSATLK
jgi:O-methyltransferase involved in polyketide biosynthesis